MRLVLSFLFIIICGVSCTETNKSQASNEEIKQHLLSLERKWLDAEFALDTGYVATLLDPSFIDISGDGLHTKQQALKGMYDNISAMRQDSIFLDSLKLEDEVVNVYDNAAVVTFVVHTYKKEKGNRTEKRTRFYDVWVNRNGDWKAVSSQGTPVNSN